MDITLYLVGTDQDEAEANFPFDSISSARSFADDNPGTQVFSVTATIDFNTVKPV